MSGREEELWERAVTALEKIAEEPIMQTVGGPPICPHCNTLNPRVTVIEGESVGPLVEFCMIATCGPCGNTIYGVPLEWAIFSDAEEARGEISRRAGALNGNGGN